MLDPGALRHQPTCQSGDEHTKKKEGKRLQEQALENRPGSSQTVCAQSASAWDKVECLRLRGRRSTKSVQADHDLTCDDENRFNYKFKNVCFV